uniref:Putative ribonuclease H-like domain-containing protein n=1 Tax=Tanacetum cinerariifolium TaxID=118510 RepID=A0A6L2L5N1_TANCI|nr:putative ribonuclease H-like domain-containing protein [Tanacetum cinerariifolium]
MCIEFEKMMHKKFQMSSMGEITFFLGLQVKQKEDGIFISQDKYVNENLNKFGFSDVKTASTPMETYKTLLKDKEGEDVDEHLYRSMTGSLMYLTSSRPDIMEGCLEWNGKAAKDKIGIINVVRIETKQKQKERKNINEEAQLHAKVDGKKVVISEASIRRDLRFRDEVGIDCLPNEIIFEQLSLIGAKTTTWNEFSSTIASSVICLATDQKFNFSKYIFDSMMKNLDNATKVLMFLRSLGKTRRQDTELPQTSVPTETVTDEALNAENVPPQSNDPPLLRVNILGSEENRLKLKQLMKLYTKLSDMVLNLETTKTSQAQEITSLKKRVKRLEKKRSSRTHGLKRLYKVGLNARVESSIDEESLSKEDASKQERISDIDANEDIYLVNVHRDEDILGVNDQDDTSMFDVDKDLQGEKVVVEKVDAASIATAAATTAVSFDELTMAQTLVKIKNSRPKAKKPSTLKNKSFAEIKELFYKAMARINNFVDFRTEPVEKSTKKDIVEIAQEGSSKRAGDELEQEISKKQKIEDENESVELKRCLEIVPDDGDDVTIEATPLSSKSPTIVGYKIYKEGRKNYF